jgi:hypothetical protein
LSSVRRCSSRAQRPVVGEAGEDVVAVQRHAAPQLLHVLAGQLLQRARQRRRHQARELVDVQLQLRVVRQADRTAPVAHDDLGLREGRARERLAQPPQHGVERTDGRAFALLRPERGQQFAAGEEAAAGQREVGEQAARAAGQFHLGRGRCAIAAGNRQVTKQVQIQHGGPSCMSTPSP